METFNLIEQLERRWQTVIKQAKEQGIINEKDKVVNNDSLNELFEYYDECCY